MLEQYSAGSAKEFSGRVAVVSGSSSGIGKAIAVALASRGTSICLLGRNPHTLAKVEEELAAASAGQILRYAVDLTQDREIEELAKRVRAEFGGVDMLIHGAGIISLGKIVSSPVSEFDAQYCTNVRAVYSLTQAMLPLLQARRGQIVFLNSTAGLTAGANIAQYSATKHALKAMADSLREEVNSEGLRVLSVFIGRTATPMQASVHAMEGKVYDPNELLQPEDVASVVINALSLPKTAEVTEIRIRPLIKHASIR
jgi:NADP-dependent 3-hydroxy acid dehydrogenase YdfG